MRLQIPKLTSAKTIIRRSANPLFRTATTWPRDVTYLRKVYSDIHSHWATDSDERLYHDTEPRVREMMIGLDKVASQLSHNPDIFRVARSIKKDFKLAEIYAREKDYPAAITRLSYSLMTFCGALNGLDKIAMKKIAYGYDLCLTGDTKIPLLDGTEVFISDLIGRDKFWVYSLNDKGLLRPGLGQNARLTQKNVPILTVTLDNGLVIRCTPNHPFLMRNGEYKAAELLMSGDSLMPLYRNWAPLEIGGNEYETTYQPGDNSWKFTHRFAEARCPKGYVRHHVDFNRFNNSPDNLALLTWEEHLKLHQSIGVIVTEKVRAARRKNMLKINAKWAGKPTPHKRVPKDGLSIEDRKRAGERGAKVLTIWNKSEAGRNKSGQRQSEYWRSLWQTDSFRQAAVERARKTSHIRWHLNRGLVDSECQHCKVVNHKVVSVMPSGTADVYDISVEKYHNFALSAGVFVHNSGEVMEPGEQESRSPNLWDQGNSPKFDRTPSNPANQLVDSEAENEYPEELDHRNEKVKWPARTR